MQQNIHVTARAVIICNNHILLAYDPRPYPEHYYQPGKTFYYLPGGHVDFHESAQNAIIREIEEETGYSGKCERFLGVFEHFWSYAGDEECCHTHEINLVFKVNISNINELEEITLKEEHVAFKWVNIDELDSTDMRPQKLKLLLPEWLNCNLNNALKTSAI